MIDHSIHKRNFIFIQILLILCIGLQVFVIKMFSTNAIVFLLFSILVLLLLVGKRLYLNDISLILLLLNFLPLIILNNEIHYNFILELISFLPLFILTFLALFKYFFIESNFVFQKVSLKVPIVLFIIYFGINALRSVSAGKNLSWITIEYFQICLYGFIIPISYMLKKREKYFFVFKSLLLISSLIALEYLIFNKVIFNVRFVTFQSSFLPLAVGCIFAYFLFTKNRVAKIGSMLLLFIFLTGIFVTLTRTLWVATFIVLIIVFLLYIELSNRLKFYKILFSFLIVIALFSITKDSLFQLQTNTSNSQSIEYKTQSISKPLEDASFLMRVELGYYAFQKVLIKPFLGSGLGDYVKFRFFSDPTPEYYIDNSLLYILWKGGIIGLILFLWIYIRFFKSAFYILKNTKELKVKIVIVGLIAGFFGLIILAIFSGVLIKYKATAVIAFLFAYIEFERKQILDIKYSPLLQH